MIITLLNHHYNIIRCNCSMSMDTLNKKAYLGPCQQCQFWHHIYQLCLFATVCNSWKSEHPRGIFRTLPNV